MFSIVIPAYQEDEYLPRLLESLKTQTFKKFETLIVSPNPREEINTVSRRLDYNLVKDKKKGPGAARNLGASFSSQPYLFFLDADVYLPDNGFLKTVKKNIVKKKINFATFLGFYYDRGFFDNVTVKIVNRVIELKSIISPHALEFATLIKSSLFRKVGGFPENYKIAEGHGLANRVLEKTNEKLHIFPELKVAMSGRRLKKEGRIKLYSKILWSELNLALGNIKNLQKVEYSFEH